MPRRSNHRSRERRRAERLNRLENIAFWACIVAGIGLIWICIPR